MREYLDTLRQVREYGQMVPGRNSNTLELFGIATRYNNIGDNFPLLTTKKMAFKSIVGELLAFLRGYDDVKAFRKLGCKVWDNNAESEYWKENPNYEKDYLGPIYGVQWRDWQRPGVGANGAPPAPVDQIADLIEALKVNRHSRRHIVSAWNPGEIDQMCLPPCHIVWQCNVDANGVLNLLMYQRSADMFLGVPFNIASYSLLMLILCKLTGYRPGSFTHMIGSAHIYESHLGAVDEQLTRLPGAPCQVELINKPRKKVEEFLPSDFVLVNYEPQPAIKADMIV